MWQDVQCEECQVTCSILDVPSTSLSELNTADVKKYFRNEASLFNDFNPNSTISNGQSINVQPVAKRQGGGTACFAGPCTLLVGDGASHPAYLYKEISVRSARLSCSSNQ